MKQYYSHPPHHLNQQNFFLDHSAHDKIVWAYPVAAAVPTQVQPEVRQHSACPVAGPFNLAVTSVTAANSPAFTHAPCTHPCPALTHTPCTRPAAALWHSFCPVVCPLVLSLLVRNSCLYTCSGKDGCKKPHFLFAIFHCLAYVFCFARTYSNNFCSEFPLPHSPMTILQWHLKDCILGWCYDTVSPVICFMPTHGSCNLKLEAGEAGGIPWCMVCVQFSQTRPALFAVQGRVVALLLPALVC